MSLLETLRKDMFSFSKNGEKDKADILGMAIAEIKNAQINSEKELTEEDIIAVLRKEVKKVNDSIEQYTQMGREDLVEQETVQLDTLNVYLPQLMSKEEIEKVVKSKMEELGVSSMQDMGRLMGTVMKELQGKADGSQVKEVVQGLLK
ncbi:GatB/YqeY domain-containing protein [bacterium]|nr:GatB/YqeY domain-containing protein [bacterium]